jgi:hypothetical protein
MSTELSKFYHHIDNGGVNMNIKSDVLGNITIKQSAEYFGYPAYSNKMTIPNHLSKDVLDKMIECLTEARSKIQ